MELVTNNNYTSTCHNQTFTNKSNINSNNSKIKMLYDPNEETQKYKLNVFLQANKNTKSTKEKRKIIL